MARRPGNTTGSGRNRSNLTGGGGCRPSARDTDAAAPPPAAPPDPPAPQPDKPGLPWLVDLLDRAIKEVPYVRYAFGLVGVAAAAALVVIIFKFVGSEFSDDGSMLGMFVLSGFMVVFMFVLFLFTRIEDRNKQFLQLPAKIVAWLSVAIVVAPGRRGDQHRRCPVPAASGRDGVFQARLARPEAAARQIQIAPGLRPVLQRFRQGGRPRLCRTVHQLLDEGLLPGVLRLHAAGAGRRGAARRRFRLHRAPEPWRVERCQPAISAMRDVRLAGFSRPEAADRSPLFIPVQAGNAPACRDTILGRLIADPKGAASGPVKGFDISHHNQQHSVGRSDPRRQCLRADEGHRGHRLHRFGFLRPIGAKPDAAASCAAPIM